MKVSLKDGDQGTKEAAIMATTLQTPSTRPLRGPADLSAPTKKPHLGTWILAGVAVLVLIAAAVVVGLHPWTTTQNAPTVATAVSAQQLYGTSYGPGSAVYAEQVPAAAASWTDAYGPGSTTYAEQVPGQAAQR